MLDIIRSCDAVAPVPRGIALGNFDGVHRGHVKIINTLLEECGRMNIRSTVYTFDPHPGSLFGGNWKSVMTSGKKAEIIGSLGAKELYFQHFDKDFAQMSPENFVKYILAGRLNVSLAVVGDNYSFGHMGAGNAELLKKLGAEYGFRVIIVEALRDKLSDGTDTVISTTVLKKLLKEGRIEDYTRLAGRYYSLQAEIVRGKKRGSSLDFPTINMIHDGSIFIPENGVYATLCKIGGTEYRGITNIGNNPTFGDIENTVVETNLLGYSGDLYGTSPEIQFVGRIRDEIKFASPEELKAQINRDRTLRETMDI